MAPSFAVCPILSSRVGKLVGAEVWMVSLCSVRLAADRHGGGGTNRPVTFFDLARVQATVICQESVKNARENRGVRGLWRLDRQIAHDISTMHENIYGKRPK